jgi:hypothetical protein
MLAAFCVTKMSSLLAYFPYSELIKVSLCDRHTVWAPINLWMPTSIFMKLGTWAHSNGVHYKSHPSVCMYLYSKIVARKRLGKKRYRGKEYPLASFSMRSVSYWRKIRTSSSENFFINTYLQTKIETINYVHGSRETQISERLHWRYPANTETYRPDFSSERAPHVNKLETVKKNNQREWKIGRGSQMGAWYQHGLADWLSVVI